MRISNNPSQKNLRRIKALHRLEYTFSSAPLATKQEDRIAKEAETLSKRIMPPEVARASRSKIYRGVK